MTLHFMKKLVVAVIGFTVLALGIIMLVTPGPAVIVIPVGLAILGTEFLWARKLLRKMKEEAGKMGSRMRGKSSTPKSEEQRREESKTS